MTFTIPPLPWAEDAIVGFSKEQIYYHYEKHHKGYATKLNAAAQSNAEIAKKSIDQLMKESGPTQNLALQIWNHTFFWNCLAPKGGGEPKGKLAEALTSNFGSVEKFKTEFTAAAVGHFGSGWAWLVKDAEEKLRVVQTHDAGCPVTEGLTPILTADVWEHAYYIDYRNDRAAYMRAYWNAVNWDFAESNL